MRRLRQILPSPLAGAGRDATTWLGGRPRSPLHHLGLHLQWVQILHWGWQAGQGYLPVGLPAPPAHPRYCVPVGSPARMVGRLPCPFAGAGRAPLHRHGLLLQALHLPILLQALHLPGLLLQWSTHQAACALTSSCHLGAASPSRTTPQRPQRSQRTHHAGREPFLPARQLGVLHAPTRLPQCGLHASAVGLLI